MVAETPTAAACSNERLVGLGTNWSSLADMYSAKAPAPHPITSSPARKRSTPSPTASTVPATSVPGIGDFGFLIAMFLIFAHLGTLSFVEVFERAGQLEFAGPVVTARGPSG